ncbi:class II aldolase/adducin family protein [Oscillibacter sp.]|uniref:class II aldolase/adducin family protein n=1 Tax=Oscillibacter sp. TaxID=1945593 RepID=UPI002D7FD08F|nr:class II aldolase/adducin family protein [Oscillibacter sp.]
MTEQEIRAEMCAAGRRLLVCHLNHATAGNISVRLDSRTYLISPSGFDLAKMTEEDIMKLDEHGKILSGHNAPSSEWQFHLGIFAARPDVNAIIHTHAPYMTAFAVANVAVTDRILPEFVNLAGELPVVPYAIPHTKELADAVCREIAGHDCVLIANHGSITVGSSLAAAMNCLETSEFTCQVSILSKFIGPAATLTQTKA